MSQKPQICCHYWLHVMLLSQQIYPWCYKESFLAIYEILSTKVEVLTTFCLKQWNYLQTFLATPISTQSWNSTCKLSLCTGIQWIDFKILQINKIISSHHLKTPILVDNPSHCQPVKFPDQRCNVFMFRFMKNKITSLFWARCKHTIWSTDKLCRTELQ